MVRAIPCSSASMPTSRRRPPFQRRTRACPHRCARHRVNTRASIASPRSLSNNSPTSSSSAPAIQHTIPATPARPQAACPRSQSTSPVRCRRPQVARQQQPGGRSRSDHRGRTANPEATTTSMSASPSQSSFAAARGQRGPRRIATRLSADTRCTIGSGCWQVRQGWRGLVVIYGHRAA